LELVAIKTFVLIVDFAEINHETQLVSVCFYVAVVFV